jgi:NhaA family Na+:H+ antiporter
MLTRLRFFLENSLFLLTGAVLGLLWANIDHSSYQSLLHTTILENDWLGTLHGHHRTITLHWLVNDLFMAFFFAIAGKEVWEACLPGGPLSSPKKAATPLLATLGGVIVPAALFLGGAAFIGQFAELGRGWAIPCATDIAFSYMVARFIFGAGHPAIPFLLLLAIADDAIGLIIIAVAYPQEPMRPLFLLLILAALVTSLILRRMRVHSFWPYLLISGTLSWLAFALSGLHPALGLLPIIPMMPHAHVDTGLFNWDRLDTQDTLTRFEQWWKNPVELILGLFGLLNAGVLLSTVGPTTSLVLLGLLLGKPLGIWAFGMLAAKGLRLGMPPGLRTRDLVVIGFTAGIGFTVALFVATVAFPAGAAQDSAKMGALASFLAAPLAILVARMIGVTKHSKNEALRDAD